MRDKFDRKKRIKLTEAELALGSWLYVTYKVITDETWDDVYIGKIDYLSAHGSTYHKWINSCKLCTKHIDYTKHSCGRCPLKREQRNKGLTINDWCGCGDNSWYTKVCFASGYPHSERISSAINICNVLAKELKKAHRK